MTKPHKWAHPVDVTNLPGWLGEPGALVMWARWTVDSLYYLQELDAAVDRHGPNRHHWASIDIAHVRWAAGSAIGAIDLCAAALARKLAIGPKRRKDGTAHEFDLADLIKSVDAGRVRGGGAAWARNVSKNKAVVTLTAIRHPTTHARLTRHFGVGGNFGERTRLSVPGRRAPMAAAAIVKLARTTATNVVEDFFDRIATLKI